MRFTGAAKAHLARPRRIIPSPPTRTPACKMPQGRANDPDPILALAKLKNVAISLVEKGGGRGGRGGEKEERGRERGREGGRGERACVCVRQERGREREGGCEERIGYKGHTYLAPSFL